ncbi:InlB B-repeat-containing protein [Turneriella parva]|uniref:InlB B-repeat-containing protein n=1 Tax=Turneriella parva TaxID=29510 RepID=UPI00145DA02E|nr:InlB B-repeat-containing protein [Turneriella parva]
MIGIEGGEIVADDGSWKLTVPAFALRFPQEITITSDATAVGTVGAEYRKVSKAFKFEPHGLFFEQPANFWFKYEQGDMPEGSLQEKLVAMHYVHDDSKLERTRTTVNAALNEATSAMQHFSIANGLTNRIEKVIDGTISNTNPVQNTANDLVLHFAQLADDAARQAEYLAYQTLIDAFVAKTEQILGYNPLFQAFPGIFPTGTTGGYNIIYNANGAESGTAPSDSTIYPTGNNATILGNTGSMTRAYHTFAGWNTAADGSGTLYVAGASLAIASANVVLHAQWVEDAKYTITYHANTSTGGTVPVDVGQYYAGMSVIVSANTGGLHKSGAILLGWNTAADGGGTLYVPGQPLVMPGAHMTLYAHWQSKFTRLEGVAGKTTRGTNSIYDSLGNTYVVGITDGNLHGENLNGTIDTFVSKYSPTRVRQWTRLIGTAGKQVLGAGVAVDTLGNLFVTGRVLAGGSCVLHGESCVGSNDTFLVKYDSAGTRIWTRIVGIVAGSAIAMFVAIDANGHSLISGTTTGSLHGEAMTGAGAAFLIKYDTEGVREWTRLSSVAAASTGAYGVRADSAGNYYVSGGYNRKSRFRGKSWHAGCISDQV